MPTRDIETTLKETFNHVIGVDEVGRGSLAGEVYVVACELPDSLEFLGKNMCYLRDSKKISELRREKMYNLFMDGKVLFEVGIATVNEIDALNILQATKLAMKRAIENLIARLKGSVAILVDGNFSPELKNCHIQCIPQGDSKESCISTASILAKVCRDRKMKEYATTYPDWAPEFFNSKGYGTKKHIEKIRLLYPNITPIHRKSFAPIKQLIGKVL